MLWHRVGKDGMHVPIGLHTGKNSHVTLDFCHPKKKKGFDLPVFDRDLEDQGLTFAVSFSTIGKQCVAVS